MSTSTADSATTTYLDAIRAATLASLTTLQPEPEQRDRDRERDQQAERDQRSE